MECAIIFWKAMRMSRLIDNPDGNRANARQLNEIHNIRMACAAISCRAWNILNELQNVVAYF